VVREGVLDEDARHCEPAAPPVRAVRSRARHAGIGHRSADRWVVGWTS